MFSFDYAPYSNAYKKDRGPSSAVMGDSGRSQFHLRLSLSRAKRPRCDANTPQSADCLGDHAISREIVLGWTLSLRAISLSGSPRSRRRAASLCWCGVSLKGSAQALAARFGPLPAFTSSGAYQRALELRQPAEDGQHQTSVRRRRVLPRVGEGSKPGFFAGNRREG